MTAPGGAFVTFRHTPAFTWGRISSRRSQLVVAYAASLSFHWFTCSRANLFRPMLNADASPAATRTGPVFQAALGGQNMTVAFAYEAYHRCSLRSFE